MKVLILWFRIFLIIFCKKFAELKIILTFEYQITTTQKPIENMTISTLISKLSKMNIPYTILENNGYNKDFEFSINGLTFNAGFTEGKNIIQNFYRETSYDNVNQQIQIISFENFTSLCRYANS